MIVVGDILVSNDVFNKEFVCALNACKGACCWEGDYGAPLEKAEIQWLSQNMDKLIPYLHPDGRELILDSGVAVYYSDLEQMGTPLRSNGSCAYMVLDVYGKAQCGIQMAYNSRGIGLQKPISCHLFPLRVLEEPHHGFVAINYEQWEICNAGCHNGEILGIPIFRFVKDALIRRFGILFYEELERIYFELNKIYSPDDQV